MLSRGANNAEAADYLLLPALVVALCFARLRRGAVNQVAMPQQVRAHRLYGVRFLAVPENQSLRHLLSGMNGLRMALKRPVKRSLRRKLPALIGLLLIASVGTFGTIAYSTAREATLRSSYARLEDVAEHVSSLLNESLGRGNQRTAAAAEQPVFAAFIVSRDAESEQAALAELRRRRPGAARSVYEIRDATGRTILSGDSLQMLDQSAESIPGISYDSASTGPIRMRNGHLSIESGAPIFHEGKKIGSLVEMREFTLNDGSATRITELIGDHAGILIGNADGSLWTDLSGKTHALPTTMEGTTYEREDELKIGRSVPIPNSALAVAVDLPAANVLAPIDRMVEPLLVIALVIILGGTITGWFLIRTITEPLAHLTAASEAMAAREFGPLSGSGPVVPSERDDEIGVLSRAFAGMSSRVQESTERLEQQVNERTRELRDALTQLQETQKELVVKERLATLGQLSSSVGHELRNPLGVMTNAAYLLEAALANAPEKAPHYLQMIRSQIGLSEKIVSDLLDFTRIRSPQRSMVTIESMVDEQLSRIRVPDTVRVVREIPGDLPLVNVDRVQIGQVLFNLFTNAIQAMEGNSGAAKTLLLRARRSGQMIELEVIDNGPGITAENLPKVFEPLFTTRARGIGLGLSVSRSLAQANGGSLTATSELGQGATFCLSIPVDSA